METNKEIPPMDLVPLALSRRESSAAGSEVIAVALMLVLVALIGFGAGVAVGWYVWGWH